MFSFDAGEHVGEADQTELVIEAFEFLAGVCANYHHVAGGEFRQHARPFFLLGPSAKLGGRGRARKGASRWRREL